MGILKNLSGLVKAAAVIGVVYVEDHVEKLLGRETRTELLKMLRKASERGAELAVEKAKLEEEVDHLRFNGPSLWKDEVEALNDAIRALSDFDDDHNPKAIEVLDSLLNRCDHMPMTKDELEKQCEGVMQGIVPFSSWNAVFDDPGVDVDGVDHTSDCDPYCDPSYRDPNRRLTDEQRAAYLDILNDPDSDDGSTT